VGSVVGELSASGLNFSNLPETQNLLKLRDIEISIPDLRSILEPKFAIINNRSLGGVSPGEVKRMSVDFDKHLSRFEATISQKRDQIKAAQKLTNDVIDAALLGEDIRAKIQEICVI
jgi:hypothetical protein